jgi:hypothetical protein
MPNADGSYAIAIPSSPGREVCGIVYPRLEGSSEKSASPTFAGPAGNCVNASLVPSACGPHVAKDDARRERILVRRQLHICCDGLLHGRVGQALTRGDWMLELAQTARKRKLPERRAVASETDRGRQTPPAKPAPWHRPNVR